MSENLLKNASFEEGTHHQEFGEINAPDGWVAFWYEGPAPHDPQNPVGYARPEMTVIPDAPPFKGPNRVHSDSQEPTPKKALKYFAFSKIMDAGLYQTVAVQPGTRLRATAWAHGWSNDGWNKQHKYASNPRWSEGEGVEKNAFYAEDGPDVPASARNMRFRVGIDPSGGTDARAATVVWGKAAYVYNAHAQLPAAEAVAQAAQVTVFLRCDVLWPFKHNDAYWDDAELVAVGAAPETPEGLPEPAYVLLPPQAGPEWVQAVVNSRAWLSKKWLIGSQRQAASAVRAVIAVNPGQAEGVTPDWFSQNLPGVQFVAVEAASPVELTSKLEAYG